MKKIIYRIITVIIILTSFCLDYYLNIEGSIENSTYANQFYKESFMIKQPAENETLNLYAQSAVIIDADTNRILYAKNAEKEMPMASTTKIMTCICALENSNPDDYVTISSKAASQPKVHLGVSEGEQYKLHDLLYSLMLESHNDAAVAIAEHVSTNVEGFAKLMNQKARDLGCYNTYFITPNGLDATVTLDDKSTDFHHTTAYELAKIMNYCISLSDKKDEFLEITRAASHSFNDINNTRSHTVSNHNAALTSIEGAISGKTGFTNDAGYCYVGAFESGKSRFIIALLACGWPDNKGYKWIDCKTLLKYAEKTFSYKMKNVKDYEIQIPSIDVMVCDNISKERRKAEVTLSDEDNFKVLQSESDSESVTFMLPKALEAPTDKNTPIGVMFYKINNTIIKSAPVYLKENIPDNNYTSYFKHFAELIMNMAV